MTWIGLAPDFAWERCGSPSLAMPRDLTDDASFHCCSCGRCIGSWGAFKGQIARLILSELARLGRPRTSDPSLPHEPH